MIDNEPKNKISSFLKKFTDNWSEEDVLFIYNLFFFNNKEIKNAQISTKVISYDEEEKNEFTIVSDSLEEFLNSFKGLTLIQIEIKESEERKMILVSRELEEFLAKNH